MVKSNNFKEYDDLGVRFIYPNNWTVQTETWDRGTYGVSVDSPEGSFWALAIYPKSVDLDDAAKKILSELHAEYDELEEEEITRYVADYVLEGYEMNFFYLDMTSVAQALKFEDENRGYVVFWQTCDRLALTDENLSRVDVFEAMTHTLVSNLTGQEVEYWDDEDFSPKKTEKQVRAEEEREYYRRRYENARREIQDSYWRSGGYRTGEDAGLEDFVVSKSGSVGGRRKEKLSDLLNEHDEAPARSVCVNDERLEDFLRPDDEDDANEEYANDGYERAGFDERFEGDDEDEYDSDDENEEEEE